MIKPTIDLCTEQRLRSAWASAQSDQHLCCLHEETLGPKLPIQRTAKALIRLAYMPDHPTGEKSHGISNDLMVLRRGMPISRFFFLISSTFGSFFDVFDLSSLTCLRINTFTRVILLIESFSK